jgi:hypothetical protein
LDQDSFGYLEAISNRITGPDQTLLEKEPKILKKGKREKPESNMENHVDSF